MSEQAPVCDGLVRCSKEHVIDEMHAAICGTARVPGMAETQRTLAARLEQQEERLVVLNETVNGNGKPGVRGEVRSLRNTVRILIILLAASACLYGIGGQASKLVSLAGAILKLI